MGELFRINLTVVELFFKIMNEEVLDYFGIQSGRDMNSAEIKLHAS